MSILAVNSGNFCLKEQIIMKIKAQTNQRLVTDNDVVSHACSLSKMTESKIRNAFSEKIPVFNQFTHEKEKTLAYLKLALAELIGNDEIIIDGFCSMLVPKDISHVLKVCIIADMNRRVKNAISEGFNEKDATAKIHKYEQQMLYWIDKLFKIKDPWDISLYDIMIPSGKTSIDEAVSLIIENSSSFILKPTEASRKAYRDFLLSSKVGVELANKGHDVEIISRSGSITILINKNVLRLDQLEEELKSEAEKIEGVVSVETRIGKGFHRSDVYRRFDFDTPSKILLVDDEREFVQTLSERLIMRKMGSVIAYDGESALDLIREEEPEVMILDLKMPGIDGIEVLRRVKQTNPKVEVIILTGHGSEKDRELCMELGAFAYLRKPVNIELLGNTLKEAYNKIKAGKNPS